MSSYERARSFSEGNSTPNRKPGLRVVGGTEVPGFQGKNMPNYTGPFTVAHHYAGGGNHSTHQTMDEAVAAIHSHATAVAEIMGKHKADSGIGGMVTSHPFSIHGTDGWGNPAVIATGTANHRFEQSNSGPGEHVVALDFDRDKVTGPLSEKRAAALDEANHNVRRQSKAK